MTSLYNLKLKRGCLGSRKKNSLISFQKFSFFQGNVKYNQSENVLNIAAQQLHSIVKVFSYLHMKKYLI